MRLALLGLLLAVAPVASMAGTIPVCDDCQFRGGAGLQQAIDAAADGDTIAVRAGTYTPAGTRDVPFDKYTIRGGWLIDGKSLTIAGEDGTVLDGAGGPPASAIVVRGGQVTLRDLRIRDFRWEVEEDDIYDGHGVFVIDADVRLERLRFEKIAKMGLTARGSSQVAADEIEMRDGHVGIWLEETSQLRLRKSRIVGNDSAALTAYGRASAAAIDCTFTGNRDDGVYAAGDASIVVTGSVVTGNKPYGLNVKDRGRIWIGDSLLAGNAKSFPARGVRLGPKVRRTP